MTFGFLFPKQETENERKEVFQVLEGEEQISLQADEILNNAKKEVFVFASNHDIPNLSMFGSDGCVMCAHTLGEGFNI